MTSQKPNNAKSENGTHDTHGYTDGRKRWEWKSKYDDDAKSFMKTEAMIVAGYLFVFLFLTGLFASFSSRTIKIDISYFFGAEETLIISNDLLLTFFLGGLGGTTFSIKWLMHSVGTGSWHLDRFYWRLFVPLVGCVYAVIVIKLLDGGLIKSATVAAGSPVVLAFLIGYFSDGVSGLLTNIANAIFGTIEKK